MGNRHNDIHWRNRWGFTIAEVLITIGIIGIVAAMTVPTLIKNTQKQEIITAYKEAFSQINQATMAITSDNGGTLAGLFTDATTLINLYSQKLKVIKTCFPDGGGTTCGFPTEIPSSVFNSTFTLANGVIVGVGKIDTNCDTNYWGLANFGQNLCTEFVLNVNGEKKPNKRGEDIFWIGINPKGQAIPAGSSGMINAGYQCPGGVYCNSSRYLYN